MKGRRPRAGGIRGVLVLVCVLAPLLGSAALPASAAPERAGSATAPAAGWTQLPPPASRCCGAMAFDEVLQAPILFGGIDEISNFNDTWSWDGTNWHQLFPPTSPGPLYDVALADDAGHRQVVLFGGANPLDERTNQTWTWDGSTWTQRFPATSPSARDFVNSSALAYDAATQTVVLFGGCCDSSNFPLSDTWTWDGTTWTQRFPTTVPRVSSEAALAYDAARQQVVLYGGCCGYSNTWTWDGTNWTLHPGATGTLNAGPAAYDAATQTVVLEDQLGVTWSWDGTSWTQLAPPTSPPGRDQTQLAYDAATQTILLFGGSINGFSQADTWVWNGATWAPRAVAPAPRQGAALAYQGATSALVLFGGLSRYVRVMSDTWAWNGARWVQFHPPIGPGGRFNASFVDDPAAKASVLFGGAACAPGCSTQTALGDTWTWNGSAWAQAAPASSPSARQQAAAAYDAAHQRVVLFGGKDASGTPLADTWSWDGSTWTQLSPAAAPPARYGATLADTPTTRTLVLFGGCADAACTTVLGDTWAWDGTTWSQQAPAASPPARSQASAAPSQGRQAAILFGGTSAQGRALADTWAWDGTTWTRLTLARAPAARANASAAFDAHTQSVVLVGGQAGFSAVGDAWALQ